MKKLIRCAKEDILGSEQFQKMQNYLENGRYKNNIEVIRMEPANTDDYGKFHKDSFIVMVNNDEGKHCGYISYNYENNNNKVMYSLYNAISKSANLTLFVQHINRFAFAADVFEDYFNYIA